MWFWIIIFAAIIITKHFLFSPQAIGKRGERKVASVLSSLPKEYLVLNNIILNNSDGSTSQIDHLILSPYGIFVIETKNYKGWIVGSEKGHTWTKVVYKRKYSFENPILQNYGHTRSVSKYLDIPTNKIIPIVVFGNGAEIKIQIKDSLVINIRELHRTVASFQTRLFTDEELRCLSEIVEHKETATKGETKEHIESIKGRINENEQKIRAGICPKCGGTLVRRHGKYGSFTGCSNYPKCRYTKQ